MAFAPSQHTFGIAARLSTDELTTVMARQLRSLPGGLVYHVMNRAISGMKLFESPAEYDTFVRILGETAEKEALRVLAYCLMPNHWHLLLWPLDDGNVSRFVQRISLRHTWRWQARRNSLGRGHLYQGRFRSCAVQDEGYLFAACRYIERNPVRAGLVATAADWRWSSAAAHCAMAQGNPVPGGAPLRLTALPMDLPSRWADELRCEEKPEELKVARTCLQGGLPLGDPSWQRSTALRLGLTLTGNPRGRPSKQNPSDTGGRHSAPGNRYRAK